MRFRENVQAASSDLGTKILGLCAAEPRVQYRVERLLVWVVRSVGTAPIHAHDRWDRACLSWVAVVGRVLVLLDLTSHFRVKIE